MHDLAETPVAPVAAQARNATVRAFCIGHVPPRFAPAMPYTMLSPKPLGVRDELVMDDHRFGSDMDGAALAEYSQLFGLQDLIEAGDLVTDRLYLFQYRKFIGFQLGGSPATAPWVRIVQPAEAVALFPSAQQLQTATQAVVVGSMQPLGGSIAQNYALVHVIDDLVMFAACLADCGMDAAAVRRFTTFQGLIPSPALCLVDTPVFLRHMRVLRAAWTRFARDCAVPREGYQRRVAGYLLERLHSHLLCQELLDGSQTEVGIGHRYVVVDTGGMKVGLVSIQKNRAPWLHEWVAFHHLVGFHKFYVYAHNCTDDSGAVLQKLGGAYDLQAFSLNTQENQVQLKAYQHAYETFGHECDWLAFIDGDEFLFPTAASTIGAALAPYAYRRVSAIGAYWVCFGSSGHLAEPAGLITENYTRRPPLSFPDNSHVKSIVRGRQASQVGPNSHLFATPWGTQDELGRDITFGRTPYEPSFSQFRVNHYVTQSLQFFKQFKQTSGAADAGAGYVRPDSWWAKHDQNDEADDSMLPWLPRLKAEMARLALPGAGVLAPSRRVSAAIESQPIAAGAPS